MDKEILTQEIKVPEGYTIDKENSTFEKIIFKKITPTRWRNDENNTVKGFIIQGIDSKIITRSGYNYYANYNVFATEKQAKSALAMARISQIMANDKRFGGVVTDEEWSNVDIIKFVIHRFDKEISVDSWCKRYHFLAFHAISQRNLFLKENMDLIKDYFMIE